MDRREPRSGRRISRPLRCRHVDQGPGRRLLTAEIISVGSELTVGETRDTNAGELARNLTLEGVTVGRIVALPDRLATVTEAFLSAFERADLVLSTGGWARRRTT